MKQNTLCVILEEKANQIFHFRYGNNAEFDPIGKQRRGDLTMNLVILRGTITLWFLLHWKSNL